MITSNLPLNTVARIHQKTEDENENQDEDEEAGEHSRSRATSACTIDGRIAAGAAKISLWRAARYGIVK
jgi:hypothetical protein